MAIPSLSAAAARSRLTRASLPLHEMEVLVQDCAAELKTMDGSKVLITGATGWFGTWLLDVLLTACDLLAINFEITALSRDPQAFLRRKPGFAGAPTLRWLTGDVRQIKASSFGYVIHAATESGTNAGQVAAKDMFETILFGTGQALDAVGSECRGFLLFSSGAVYGSQSSVERLREDMLLGPDPASSRSAYAEGKRAAETLCAISAQRGIPARIARCFAFVGPHMPFDRHFAIGNFIADAVQGRPIRIRSDGSPVRSYLYMTDLMRAVFRILVFGQNARPYNVGSDAPLTVRQLAETVNSVLGGGGVTIEGQPSAHADRYVPDTTRLRCELNFEPKVGLEEAILKTASWYRTQIK